MQVIKRFFFDLETGGLDPKKSGIHQLAGLIEIDGKIEHEFNLKIAPMEGKEYTADALAVGNLTLADIAAYTDAQTQYKALCFILGTYVNKYDKTDKFYLGGWNNAYFDNSFLRQFFEDNFDNYFGSWFWSVALDVQVLAQYALRYDRPHMKDFKLGTVVEKYGIEVEGKGFHDGLYDVRATYAIFKHLTKSALRP